MIYFDILYFDSIGKLFVIVYIVLSSQSSYQLTESSIVSSNWDTYSTIFINQEYRVSSPGCELFWCELNLTIEQIVCVCLSLLSSLLWYDFKNNKNCFLLPFFFFDDSDGWTILVFLSNRIMPKFTTTQHTKMLFLLFLLQPTMFVFGVYIV